MRTLIILLALLPATLQADPASTVFVYECKEANKLNAGFTCSIDKDGYLHLQWHITPAKMTPAERERPVYESEKLLLRYVQLGFKHFSIGFDSWPKGKVRLCQRRSSSHYICPG